jgi:hypothetical protein
MGGLLSLIISILCGLNCGGHYTQLENLIQKLEEHIEKYVNLSRYLALCEDVIVKHYSNCKLEYSPTAFQIKKTPLTKIKIKGEDVVLKEIREEVKVVNLTLK